MDHADGLDRMAAVLGERCLDRCRIGAMAPVARQELGLEAEALAPARATGVAKWPVSAISTRSPGESVLTRAASQAPVPEAG